MPKARKSAKPPPAAESLATALHIGASSVSMMVAERAADGSLTPIDFLEQPAPVARDIFRQGSVSLSTTERVVSIIKGYQKSLAELGIPIPTASPAPPPPTSSARLATTKPS